MQFRNVAFDFTAILPNHRYSPNFNSITFNLNFFFRIQFSTLIRFSFFRASIKEPSGKSTRKFFQDETFCLVRWITSSASNEICQCYLWYWRYRQGRFQNSSPEIGTVFFWKTLKSRTHWYLEKFWQKYFLRTVRKFGEYTWKEFRASWKQLSPVEGSFKPMIYGLSTRLPVMEVITVSLSVRHNK